jgi:hypothetical protein
MFSPFRSNECSILPQNSGPSRINNGADLTGPSQADPGDEKDDEIARLKRAYHDAVMDTNNKKTSSKSNTYVSLQNFFTRWILILCPKT